MLQRGDVMSCPVKSVRWLVLLLVLAATPWSYADSFGPININNVNLLILPNEGGGGNVGFSFNGPGTNILGDAGTDCFDWCGGQGFGNLPGTALNPSSGLFFDSIAKVMIQGTTFDPSEGVVIFSSSIDVGTSFVFPTDGKAFTVKLPASIGSPLTLTLPDGSTVLLNIPSGTLTLSFNFVPATDDIPGHYLFTEGHYTVTAVPEPGTLALIGTGLAGLGILRRQRGVKRI